MSQELSPTPAGRTRPSRTARWLFRRMGAVQAFLYRRRIGRTMRGMELILLTTTGRRSGKPLTVPLGTIRDGDAFVVIASAGGADWNPSWWLNLVATPEAQVESGDRTLRVRMEEVSDPTERQRIWNSVVAAMPGYAAYPKKTSRVIPLGRLRRIG